MIVIGFDTSTNICSVGIVDGDKILANQFLDNDESHSVRLFPLIDRAMKSCGLKKNQLDLIAVGIGPGSFTGARISVATAKTMAYALGVPCVGVNTLDAMAYCMPTLSDMFCPVIDARKKEVYWQLYKKEGGKIIPLNKPTLTGIDKLVETCPQGTVFCGSGTNLYYEKLVAIYGGNLCVTGSTMFKELGSTIGMIAIKEFEQGTNHDHFPLTPLYLRKPEAEIQWKKRAGKEKTEQ